ncbi:MAG TPA: cation:proton antiporter [Bacillota bacterium]|nr:cation:proton antiporter [Bacillota bacterium]HPF41911.1 cation:proton antiporter [Bacillota bacterium]HPJ85616.1 cation:proton antiporter [Bacillota bacterium]HPQ61432.1 cation:proton antiporter [Bacillota bacterium]HRX91320.1 cation:proton antiporter [Candidatus Izemoplasmatales bacterium]
MDLTILFYAGIMIATGLLFGKLAKIAHLPNVTGYLIGGLLIGPSLLNIIKESYTESLDLVSMVALGFIAFTIGDEFKVSYFKKVGAKPIIIAIMEASFGVLFVFAGLILYFAITKQLDITSIRFSLILSAVAAATDPAATLMVVKQYKAKGSLTDTILGVVALDDSVAVMLFGICVAVANAIGPSTAGASLIIQILNPLKEIFFSLGIGAAMGFLLTYACLWFTGRGNRISLVVTMIFVTIYLADLVNGSTILACMALGAIFANFSKKYDEVNNLVYFITPPIFIMFFVLSGAELKLSVLLVVGVIGIVYTLMRVFGKFFGAWFGARISKAEPKIANYLGFALLPQAGVAIGLSLVATQILDADMGSQIRAIVLAATLVYELSGPVVTKTILRKTGEITVRG